MSNQHPIVPPPELVQEWIKAEDDPYEPNWQAYEEGIATRAAQWGADQELEACCEWLDGPRITRGYSDALKKHRRPKPPSLKEQALAELAEWENIMNIAPDSPIRRAIEQFPDL
jgi:hypothetical protein